MQLTSRIASRGFTLVELLVVVALGALLVSLAIPSFGGLIARKRLDGVIAELGTDLQYARSEAVQRQSNSTTTVPIFGAVATNVAGTCYVVYTYTEGLGGVVPKCTCGSPTTCEAGAIELKTVSMPSGGGGVTVTGSVTVAFDPIRGLATSAQSFVGTSNANSALTLSAAVAAVGRVRTCVPSGSSMKGYSSCT